MSPDHLDASCAVLADPTPPAIAAASDWLEHHRRFWDDRLDRLDHYLRDLHGRGAVLLRPPSGARHLAGAAWFLPAAILLLLSKSAVGLAGCAALATALDLSAGAAGDIQALFVVGCVTALSLAAMRRARRAMIELIERHAPR